MGQYYVAQICLNGHCITNMVDKNPERSAKFCNDCGSATISQCPTCKANIRGYFYVPGFISGAHYKAPSFCHECGTSYPWTQAALQAAGEIILEEESFQPEEQAALVEILPSIVSDTPRTSLAVIRLKKFAAKAGPVVGQALKDLLVSFATEAAKKGLGW